MTMTNTNMVDISQYVNPQYPAFRRAGDIVNKCGDVAKGMISKLPKQDYIRGQDGVLVPYNLFEALRQKVSGVSIKSNQLVNMPTGEAIDDVIAAVIGQVNGKIPELYQPEKVMREVKKQLGELKPNYATTLEEAANALGVKLKLE